MAQRLRPARNDPRIGGEIGDGIVAPHIGQSQGWQMTVIDPAGNRHQFDNIDTQMFEVLDNVTRRHPRQRPPQRSLHRRVAHGTSQSQSRSSRH